MGGVQGCEAVHAKPEGSDPGGCIDGAERLGAGRIARVTCWRPPSTALMVAGANSCTKLAPFEDRVELAQLAAFSTIDAEAAIC